jgi:hypothetical protein
MEVRLIGPPLATYFYDPEVVTAAVQSLGGDAEVRLEAVVEGDACRVVASGVDDQRMERCLREALNGILQQVMEGLLLPTK